MKGRGAIVGVLALAAAVAAAMLGLAPGAGPSSGQAARLPSTPIAAEDEARPAARPAAAQAEAPPAGGVDYYLLSLSWSPAYCADPDAAARDARQCAAQRPFAFVVHGLWPQYEEGWPRDCAAAEADPPPATAEAMLDLMPSPRLVQQQWDKHGACSGLSARAYFDLVRKVRTRITIPAAYERLAKTAMVTGEEVEAAFIAANPTLRPEMIAVQCNRNRLREVRVCLTRDGGAFRPCGPDVRDRCSGDPVAMLPVRGG